MPSKYVTLRYYNIDYHKLTLIELIVMLPRVNSTRATTTTPPLTSCHNMCTVSAYFYMHFMNYLTQFPIGSNAAFNMLHV